MTATATQPQHQARNQNGNNQQQADAAAQLSGETLLTALLAKPYSERHKAIEHELEKLIPKIDQLLPDFMKGQAARLVRRAMITYNKTADLWECPPGDFIRCVLEAAELGFAIDGKFCYVIKRKGKRGQPSWKCEADYKALVAAARRTKVIRDCYADIVCANDHFVAMRKNGDDILEHQIALKQRGEVIAAYAIVKLPDGDWRYELMTREELDKVEKASPTSSDFTPWRTWREEMQKKSVIRRALKMYGDDPSIIRLLDMLGDDEESQDTHGTPRAQAGGLDLNALAAGQPSMAQYGAAPLLRSEPSSQGQQGSDIDQTTPDSEPSQQVNTDGGDDGGGDSEESGSGAGGVTSSTSSNTVLQADTPDNFSAWMFDIDNSPADKLDALVADAHREAEPGLRDRIIKAVNERKQQISAAQKQQPAQKSSKQPKQPGLPVAG